VWVLGGCSALSILSLFLDNPEQIQDVNRNDDVTNNHSWPSKGQELIDSPENERGSEKQAFPECLTAWSQSNLQYSVPDASKGQWKRTKPSMRPRGGKLQI
jgi:hypothetical protein